MEKCKKNTPYASDQSTPSKQEPAGDGWHCDTYCRKVRYITCEGQNGLRENAEKRCPYLDEMLY